MRRTFRLLALAAMTAGSLSYPGTAHADVDTTTHWGARNGDAPNPVADLVGVTEIQAGNASGMALAGGNVYTWGDGRFGDLGRGDTSPSLNTAVDVTGLPPIVAIGESYDTDVAITATGAVYGWGANRQGQLCNGTTTEHDRPVLLRRLRGIVAAAGGAGHIEYLMSSGVVKECGDNAEGQLGDGTLEDSDTPMVVIGLPKSPVVAISAGDFASTALTEDGEVWDWGSNTHGQLGNGTTTDSDVPVPVMLPDPATFVYQGGALASNGQSLAILSDGTIWGWGSDSNGQLGNGVTRRTVAIPVRASELPDDVVAVATAGTGSVALTADGDVLGFGGNYEGQIGNGTVGGDVLVPVTVLTGADAISTTAANVMAHQS
jgi:alpha-tubulin suppressor-like RCC1 family protein